MPRLYEVLRQRIVNGVSARAASARSCSTWRWQLGQRRYHQGRLPPHLAALDLLLDRLVRNKVRARFGGRLKAMVSGGAPLNVDVGLFFHALGLPVLQGYGQTEASPVISANLPGKAKLDTVGPALDGVEVKIADDGEILVRGDLVMRGYWKDAEATAQTLRDGWLHTGDIGEIDADGYLKITDRKKDMIVNSGGDNVAPARVEGILLLEPEIGQALIYGDRRPHLVALIVPHQEFVRSFARAHQLRAGPRRAGAQPRVQGGDRRGGPARQQRPVADRAGAPVRGHAGAVQRRERLDDADAQAASPPDRQGAPGAARRSLRPRQVGAKAATPPPGQGSGAVVVT